MPGQAAQSYQQIASQQPDAERSLRDFADTTRTNINTAADSAQQSIDATRQGSLQAADAALTAAITQIDQACSSTVAALAAQGASQVAAIRQQGQSTRAVILQAAAAARARVGQTCEQAASGIEGGVLGLIRGARQIESPNPDDTRTQVRAGVKNLEEGARGAAAGLSQTATGSAQALSQQARSAVAGMTRIAAAARATATRLGASASQQMSTTAQASSQGLTAIANAHKTSTDTTVNTTVTGLTAQATALDTAYQGAARDRQTQFQTNLATCKGQLDGTVPDRGGAGGGAGSGKKDDGGGQSGDSGPRDEIGAIASAAQKAADAVKPWWQQALAVVVSVVVAVVVVMVVTALIATTGPVGAILVGALAGALSSVAGTMASNLVLGNGLFDGITLKSIAMGAVGGAIGAGLTEALSAGAEALASSGSAVGRGATLVKAAMSEGEGAAAGARQTLGQYALKTGIGVTNDFVTNQATSLIFDHRLDLNVENIVVSLATNGVMSSTRVAKFQADVRAQIRSRVPFHLEVPRLQIEIGAKPSSGGAPRAGGEPPAPSAGHGEPAAPRTGATEPPAAPRTGEPAAHSTGGPAGAKPHPTGEPAGAGPRPTGEPAGAKPTGERAPAAPRGGKTEPTAPRGEEPAPPLGEPAKPPQHSEPTAPRGDDPTRPAGEDPAKPHGDAPGKPRGDDPTRAHHEDPGRPRGEDPAKPRGGDPAGSAHTGDPGAPQGSGPRAPHGDDRTGAPHTDDPANAPDGKTDPGKPSHGADASAPHGEPPPAHPTESGQPHADAPSGGPTGEPGAGAPSEPGSALDTQLGELGYEQATPARRDQLSEQIEHGGTPNKDNVRDTEANQQGLRDLQQLQNDPHLTPEQKLQLERDLAARLREQPEPPGNLVRDVHDTRTRNESGPDRGPTGPHGTEPGATGTHGQTTEPSGTSRSEPSGPEYPHRNEGAPGRSQDGPPAEPEAPRALKDLASDARELANTPGLDPEMKAQLDGLRDRIEKLDAQVENNEVHWNRADRLKARLQQELAHFSQKIEAGDLRWVRGDERASDEFHQWIERQTMEDGTPLTLEPVTPGHERWPDWQESRTNAEMSPGSPTILHRQDPRKIELLEEVLHHAQQQISGFEERFPYPQYELHVKDFMVRHRDLFGLSDADVSALQQLMREQMRSGQDVAGNPLVLPESASTPASAGKPTGPDPFLETSLDDIVRLMRAEIGNIPLPGHPGSENRP